MKKNVTHFGIRRARVCPSVSDRSTLVWFFHWSGEQSSLFFGKLDCAVKTKLLKSYCFSFYGCELWDLQNVNIDALCKSWRQAVRRLWNLPYNCHVAIREALSECLPLFDVFCKRSLNFINRCLVSDNAVVSFVARHPTEQQFTDLYWPANGCR